MATLVRRIVSLAVVLIASGTASAQEAATASGQENRPPRAFTGTFGPTPTDLRRPLRVDLSASIFNAPDDNSVLTTNTDTGNQLYTGANLSLGVLRRLAHGQMSLNLGSTGRFYQDLGDLVTTRQVAAAGVATTLGRAWRLQMNGSAGYSPVYQVVFGPATAVLSSSDAQYPSDDFGVSPQRAMRYDSLLDLTRKFGDKTELTLNYGGHYTQVFTAPDFHTQRASLHVNRALNKDFSLRVGYAYGVSTTFDDPTAVPIRNKDIDFGIVYGRAFLPSDRTSFTFTTGSTIVSSIEGSSLRFTGSGRLITRLSPLWAAHVTYLRGVEVPDGAIYPFYSDTLGAAISGYFNRRVSLRIEPSYAHGTVGVQGTNSYDSYIGTARLDFGLNRRLALFTEYVYYRYQFENGFGLPSQLPSGLNRQTVRVGLTLWTPLVR